jgi:hypothetical protein
MKLILASDKCNYESDCLSFGQQMQVTSQQWQKHQNSTGTTANPTVVFTTESKRVVEEQQLFVANDEQKNFPFLFKFVTNAQDVTPDSGFISDGTCGSLFGFRVLVGNHPWLTIAISSISSQQETGTGDEG